MNEINPIDPETAVEVDEARGKLAAAVAAVMKEVKRLEKADNNAFAKYKFTSVDDYKDKLRPLLAENGLEPCLSQVGFERFEHAAKGKDSGVHCQYDFILWLTHASGEIGAPEGSTVCLPYTGAQTTGQARSYAQKEWLKSKFLASSGDTAEDADSQSFDVQLPKAEAKKIHASMIEELRDIGRNGVKSDLTKWTDKSSVMLDAMPKDWTVYLRDEYKQAQLAIDAREKGVDLGPQIKLPSNVENWLSDLDSSLGAQTTLDGLASAWSEAQEMAMLLPAEESRRAFAMREKHEQRLSA